MGDTKIVYDEKFGITTFKREICAQLGEAFWNELIENIELPDIDSECKCQCHNMYQFMKRLEEMTDEETLKKILYKVRHGLHPVSYTHLDVYKRQGYGFRNYRIPASGGKGRR